MPTNVLPRFAAIVTGRSDQVASRAPPSFRCSHAGVTGDSPARQILVGDGPDENARMIAVALDEAFRAIQICASLPSSRFSSMTNMPRRSQAEAVPAWVDCAERRYALLPISFSRAMRKYCSRSGRATPTPAWSPVVAGALMTYGLPLRRNLCPRSERHLVDAELGFPDGQRFCLFETVVTSHEVWEIPGLHRSKASRIPDSSSAIFYPKRRCREASFLKQREQSVFFCSL